MNKLSRLTDESLVRLYENGNNKAFEVLLTRYQSKVFAYIFLFVRNRELTEDLFQDTFIKAIATIRQGKYVESGKFLPWLNRIAHNLIIDHFRREHSESPLAADSLDRDLSNDPLLSEKSIEDIISNEQVLCDVLQLVDRLPDVQRSVVHMRFFEGLSFKEIAEKTDVSINTALGRMRYALLNMRRIAAENNICLEWK